MSESLALDKKFDKSMTKRVRKPRPNETDDFRAWLATLGGSTAPTVHVNGPSYSTAVVVVDFGTPLVDPVKLSAEQSAELMAQLRTVTKMLFRERDVNVRVQSDSNTGIWWSSVG